MPHRGTTRLDIYQTNVLVVMGRGWGEQGGGNGHTWNEGSHRLNLMTFATATLLHSVFVEYANNSSGISEARELVRTNYQLSLDNVSITCELVLTQRNMQPLSQGPLLPFPTEREGVGTGRREPWERGCQKCSAVPKTYQDFPMPS